MGAGDKRPDLRGLFLRKRNRKERKVREQGFPRRIEFHKVDNNQRFQML